MAVIKRYQATVAFTVGRTGDDQWPDRILFVKPGDTVDVRDDIFVIVRGKEVQTTASALQAMVKKNWLIFIVTLPDPLRPSEASEILFIPGPSLPDWSGSPPGNVNQALDRLADALRRHLGTTF